MHLGLEKSQPFSNRNTHGLGRLVKPSLALLVELLGDMGKGEDSENSYGNEGAGDEEQKNPACYLASEECGINFHERRRY